MRIGHGFDIHQFELGKPLILCGVAVSHTHGLKAHSDGDVAIHALCDAMLGAAALGDIGQHFPDSDNKNKDRDSKEFLLGVNNFLQNAGFVISNVDISLLIEEPKLAPYILKMRQSLATILEIDLGQINVKATTTEGLGFVGRQEGAAAHSVVLLKDIV